MKYPGIVCCSLILFLNTGCDGQKNQVRNVLKCGFAVDEIGTPLAKEMFRQHQLDMFNGKMPNMSIEEIDKIALQAKGDVGLFSKSPRVKLAQLIYEYNAASCQKIHQQKKISDQETPAMLER